MLGPRTQHTKPNVKIVQWRWQYQSIERTFIPSQRLPQPTCRQRAAIHKGDWLVELAVHLGHRWVKAEALLHTHSQVGHLGQIIPASNGGHLGTGNSAIPGEGRPHFLLPHNFHSLPLPHFQQRSQEGFKCLSIT